jgi:hypothetical protein
MLCWLSPLLCVFPFGDAAGRRSVEVLRDQLNFKNLGDGKPDAQKGLRMLSYAGLGHSSVRRLFPLACFILCLRSLS